MESPGSLALTCGKVLFRSFWNESSGVWRIWDPKEIHALAASDFGSTARSPSAHLGSGDGTSHVVFIHISSVAPKCGHLLLAKRTSEEGALGLQSDS